MAEKFRIEKGKQLVFAGEIHLGGLEGLLQHPLLQLDQVAVVPGKDCDFEVGM